MHNPNEKLILIFVSFDYKLYDARAAILANPGKFDRYITTQSTKETSRVHIYLDTPVSYINR